MLKLPPIDWPSYRPLLLLMLAMVIGLGGLLIYFPSWIWWYLAIGLGVITSALVAARASAKIKRKTYRVENDRRFSPTEDE